MPSVASVVWNFVREGRLLKKLFDGRDIYALDQTLLDAVVTNPSILDLLRDEEGGGGAV